MRTKEQKDLEKSRIAFEKFDKELGLSKMTKLEQSQALIDYANDIQFDICNLSDENKYTNYETIKGMDINVSKGDWLEIIGSGVKNKYKKNSRFAEKYDELVEREIYTSKLKTNILSNNIIGENSEILLPENTKKVQDKTTENNKFNEIFYSSVDNRYKINNELYPKYKEVFAAWNYIWDMKYKFEEFKLLVDDLHYYCGGYPSENTPPRTWSKIHKFNQLVRTMVEVGKEDYITKYLAKFGIKIELDEKTIKEWKNPGIYPEWGPEIGNDYPMPF